MYILEDNSVHELLVDQEMSQSVVSQVCQSDFLLTVCNLMVMTLSSVCLALHMILQCVVPEIIEFHPVCQVMSSSRVLAEVCPSQLLNGAGSGLSSPVLNVKFCTSYIAYYKTLTSCVASLLPLEKMTNEGCGMVNLSIYQTPRLTAGPTLS